MYLAEYKFSNNSELRPFLWTIAEIFHNEHSIEVRQRILQTLIFFSLVISVTLLEIKIIVKILETPVSNIRFFQLSPGEYFIATLKISLYGSILGTIPIGLTQFMAFLNPKLRVSRKKMILFLLLSSIILFILGLFFSYFLLIPAALKFFINYGDEVVEPFWVFDQYFGFIAALFISTGLVFQVPILQIILSLAQIINPDIMLDCWKGMVLLSTILGAILTPSADPITQFVLSSALYFLYLGGSFVSVVLTRNSIMPTTPLIKV
uniref:TatC n=1 Tax=Schizocladia ischiensis TaxID=196139 RepID=A0A7S6ZP92_9STRA|nr:tatC [Schizocladia ischiensis]QOW07483.1 tatC [Schizocladia ischiensis]